MSLVEITRRLRDRYPDAKYALDWQNPVQLFVATILAAQCTDERVNRCTPGLFAKYPSAQAFADADLATLEAEVKPCGMPQQKAKRIKNGCHELVTRFGGEVPQTMEEMITLPGVGRKTANVVLVTGFRIASGVIVDTHVARIAPRLGLTTKEDPDDIEEDLAKVLPKEDWLWWPPALILFGRDTCQAKKPKCAECMFADLCPKIGVAS